MVLNRYAHNERNVPMFIGRNEGPRIFSLLGR